MKLELVLFSIYSKTPLFKLHTFECGVFYLESTRLQQTSQLLVKKTYTALKVPVDMLFRELLSSIVLSQVILGGRGINSDLSTLTTKLLRC